MTPDSTPDAAAALQLLYRWAARAAHPDVGGSTAAFQAVAAARDTVAAALAAGDAARRELEDVDATLRAAVAKQETFLQEWSRRMAETSLAGAGGGVAARVCRRCGAPLANRDPRAVYCSPACRLAAWRARRQPAPRSTGPVRCVVCGTPFAAQRPSARYCSAACSQAAYRKRRQARQVPMR